MKFFIIVCVCWAMTATTVNSSDLISNAIREFILDMRDHMHCGFPDRDIPPLAPFLLDSHEFDIDLTNMGGTGRFVNVRVDGLDSFDVIQSEFTLIFLTITYNFLFQEITCEGQFADTVFRMLDNCFLNGGGNFWIQGRNVRHNGTAVLTTLGGTDGFLSMSQFTSSVDIGSFQSNFQSFTGTPAQSEACNRLIEQEFPRIVLEEMVWINNWISELILPRANENLDGMTLPQLLERLTNPNPRPPC